MHLLKSRSIRFSVGLFLLLVLTVGGSVAAFADSGKQAAFMPYMMGGFPDLATSRGIGEAYAVAGADLIELGVPFSDPLADGPVIHAAGTAALAAGVRADAPETVPSEVSREPGPSP